MQSIAVGDPGVSLSVMWMGCAKTAEWIDVLFGVETLGDPGNIVETNFSLFCLSSLCVSVCI